jgi:hypothetical protein
MPAWNIDDLLLGLLAAGPYVDHHRCISPGITNGRSSFFMTSPVQSTLGRELEYCIGHAHSPRRADEERAPDAARSSAGRRGERGF